jgi:hypothetical protein
MLPRGNENVVYMAVEAGELEIDELGQIWRVAARTGRRYGGGTTTYNVERRRAEHDIGPYFAVRVMVNHKRTTCLAHRLVWIHFHGPIPDGQVINHKNGQKKDNRPENLEVTTHSGNQVHAIRVLKIGHAAHQNGEQNYQAKLTREQVDEILVYREAILAELHTRHQKTISQLATRFGVAYATVLDIIKGKTWNL